VNQATLAGAVHFDGVGLHTGTAARVAVLPAPPDFGVQFVCNGVRIPAVAEYVVDTARATVLGLGSQRVSTVEHVLSAVLGMGIANAEIVVDGSEIPAVDGSAEAFANAFADAGIEEQAQPRSTFSVTEPFEMRDEDRALILLPSERLRVRFVADFPAPIGVEYFDATIDPLAYRREIAPARTFGYLREVEALRARGLAQGGSLNNALVFAPDGPMQNLRWPDEVVRHKVLDLLGDVALLGRWPQCDIIAVKTGHELHVRAMRELRRRERDTIAARSA
jgi:UDP-3-O-acyl N-acetylglucosamine deacetylase